MANMRNQALLRVLLSEDDTQQNQLIDDEWMRDDNTGIVTKGPGPGRITLAGAETYSVPFGKIVRASTLIIVAKDLEVQAQIDGALDPLDGTSPLFIPIRPIPADTSGNPVSEFAKVIQPGILYWAGRIKSLSLKNPSSTLTATCLVFLIGDAAA